MKYNKFVRDNIPAIIKSNGEAPVTHIASDEEYRKKLRSKLQEEVDEYLMDSSAEELADILEVIYALGVLDEVDGNELESIRKEKAQKRGAFKEKIILDEA